MGTRRLWAAAPAGVKPLGAPGQEVLTNIDKLRRPGYTMDRDARHRPELPDRTALPLDGGERAPLDPRGGPELPVDRAHRELPRLHARGRAGALPPRGP